MELASKKERKRETETRFCMDFGLRARFANIGPTQTKKIDKGHRVGKP